METGIKKLPRHCSTIPGKSAHQALERVKQRCWKYDWVLEFDIKGLFDNIDHNLLIKALKKHTKQEWIILYVERWLKLA